MSLLSTQVGDELDLGHSQRKSDDTSIAPRR
jgi:hypothetical protein